LKKFFESGDHSKIQSAHRKRLRLILTVLHAAEEIKDMNFLGSDLHRLRGDLKDYWSISVSGNWRVIFRFMDNDVYDIDYLDYH
jgi:toxin HigB-1